MICVSFGAGTNSAALLIGLYERGQRPDIILFADTGGEKPHTYLSIIEMQSWLKAVDFPSITIVKKVDFKGDVLTLEQDCINKKMLPSIAYGYKSCSQKYKIQPQDKYLNNLPAAKKVFNSGEKITKLIGFGADELGRAEIDYSCKKYVYRRFYKENQYQQPTDHAISRLSGCSTCKHGEICE